MKITKSVCIAQEAGARGAVDSKLVWVSVVDPVALAFTHSFAIETAFAVASTFAFYFVIFHSLLIRHLNIR